MTLLDRLEEKARQCVRQDVHIWFTPEDILNLIAAAKEMEGALDHITIFEPTTYCCEKAINRDILDVHYEEIANEALTRARELLRVGRLTL